MTNQSMVITDINGGARSGGKTVITNGDGTNADIDGLSMADQKDWAWDAAMKCASARKAYVDRTQNGNINYALGILQTKFVGPEPFGPVLGYNPPPKHSEPKIVAYWTDQRVPQLRPFKQGNHLILFIFTRVRVCPICTAKIPIWRIQLAAATSPGAILHVYIWQSVAPENDVGPSNLEPVEIIS